MKKNLKRILAIVLSVAVLLTTMVMSVSAAVKTYKWNGNLENGFTYRFAAPGEDYKNHLSSVIEVIQNGSNPGSPILTYCADIHNGLNNNAFKTIDLTNSNIRAILQNSYPRISNINSIITAVNSYTDSNLGDIINSTNLKQKVITATQFAVWHYSDNLNPSFLDTSKYTSGQNRGKDINEQDSDINRIYQYLVHLSGVGASTATIPALQPVVTLMADGSTKVEITYPVNANGVNENNSPIPLSYSFDNSKKWDVTVQNVDINGVASKKVTIIVAESSFGNSNDLDFDFTVSGLQTKYEAVEFVSDSSGNGNQNLVGYINNEKTISSTVNVTVEKPIRYKLSTSVQGDGQIILSPTVNNNNYLSGTEVTVTASPNSGSHFSKWNTSSGRIAPVNSKILMNGNKSIKAEFVNSAPVAVADTASIDLNTNAQKSVIIPVLANDSDEEGSALTPSRVTGSGNGPMHGTVSLNADKTFTYTYNGTTPATDYFTYKVSDGVNVSNTTKVSITISKINRNPIANGNTATIDLNSTNKTDISVTVSDPDGDTVSKQIVDAPSKGSVVLNANGTFTYTYGGTTAGTDSFTYKAIDSNGAESAPAAVEITITKGNRAPTANGKSVTIDLNVTSTVDISVTVSDPDEDNITKEIVTGPTHGSVNLNANGTFTYTYGGTTAGTDSFTYKAIDSNGAESAPATVEITITKDNRAPTANGKTVTIDLNTTSTADISVTVSDPDEDNITKEIVTGPTHGSVDLNANGTFTYTYGGTTAGTDSFTYKAIDSNGAESAPATVEITITKDNRAPTANGKTVTIDLNTTSTADISVTVSDPDEDNMTKEIVTGPTHGSVDLNSNGTFTYTYGGTTAGTDSFTYKAVDSHGAESTPATVEITITKGNRAPTANGKTVTIDLNTTSTADISVTVSDPDEDTVSKQIVTGPTHGKVELKSDGTFTYTYEGTTAGTDSFTYKAVDSHEAESEPATVSITITKESTGGTEDPGPEDPGTQAPETTQAPAPAPTVYVSPITYYTLTTSVSGQGTISPAGTQQIGKDSHVPVSASAAPGWVFDHWEGNAPVGGEIVMDGNKSVTAVFVQEVIVTETTAPAAPIVTPTPEPTETPAPTEQNAVTVEENNAPAGPAKLPKTGGIPAGLFYGLGGLIAAAGVFLKKNQK